MKEDNIAGWSNAPTLANLKQDLEACRTSHSYQVSKIKGYLDALHPDSAAEAEPTSKSPFASQYSTAKPKTRSTIKNKTIRKQAEWRYTSLSEPFLNTPDVFNVDPVGPADVEAAKQNGLVLNNQINTKLNKVAFVDEYVRTATDEGTVIVKVGWEVETTLETVDVPVFEIRPAADAYQLATLQQAATMPPHMLEDEMRTAIEMSKAKGAPFFPVQVGIATETREAVTKNQPSWEVCHFENIYIDPTCNGDITKAQFIIHSFESSRSDLEKSGKYSNLDKVNWFNDDDAEHEKLWADSSFTFADDARKKVIVYEYWGFWDTDGSGKTSPIVTAWVGDTTIRMEANPYPDGELPFVVVPFMPVRKSVYGEPDGALLKDNQDIAGAITRGMIDLFGRSANAQTGFRKGALDVINKRRFERGQDYEFNDMGDAQNSIFMHTFPEIPASAYNFLQMQNAEAESLTGVLAFNQGVTGSGLGATAAAANGALSSAARRELGILRRLAEGMRQIGHKFIAMNQKFLSEEEVVRITESEFVTIKRDDLAGRFDLRLSISTAEADEQKASELSFMLQTTAQSMGIDFTKILLSEIADLRKMPLLAQQIKNFNPAPDPIALQTAQLELAKLQAETEKTKAETQKILAESQLAMYKAANTQADTDRKNLDYVNEEAGITHARELDKMAQQSEAQSQTKIVEAAIKAQAEREKIANKTE